MSDHIKLTPNLHDAGFEDKIRETFLGQAHIAGTGPDGKTCRECKLWFVMRRPEPGLPASPSAPGYYSKSHKTPGVLKKGKCNYRIPHKANRLVPPKAKACRFFDQSDNPPAENKPTMHSPSE